MRAIVQRVSRASVSIDGATVGQIDRGLLVYVGVGHGDGNDDVAYIAGKIRHLRIFEDEAGKMNLDVVDVGGRVLLISNFTLYGDARKGRRPAFIEAAAPDVAVRLYEDVCEQVRNLGVDVETGRFQQTMAVESINDGPINLLIDSRKTA
ncbi:MAG: D-tyrosyl-tRNA(Tyr) deacylase [Planctomycetes bacterium]|nr:D-tyrosyl-tRNA(Tyr) deacylase [Planctomycetota bacterium]